MKLRIAKKVLRNAIRGRSSYSTHQLRMALMRWNKTLPGHCHFAVRMTESGNLQ